MAEDPLCTHQPGRFAALPIVAPRVEYGAAEREEIPWDDDARERMRRVPAFVRGMVIRRVESQCKKEGLARVTVEELERIRSRMPTPKLFSGRRP
jgi:hypothetical protein